jgi:hypothetical protein
MTRPVILLGIGAVLVVVLLGFTNTYNPNHAQIVFEGAFRILKGQVPFRDFAAPVGPLSFYLTAAVFKLFGVSYLSYILCAGLVNAAAACSAYLGTRWAFEDRRLALGAGVVTALWNQTFFIWPWYSEIAIAFTFAAFACLQAGFSGRLTRARAGAAAGALLACGVFTKQTAGGISLVAMCLYVAALGEWASLRAMVAAAAAAGASLTALFGWLAGGAFVRDFIVVPLSGGRVAPLPRSSYPVWGLISAAVFAGGLKLNGRRREWPLWAACAAAAGLSFVWRSTVLTDSTIPYTVYFCVPLAAAPFLEKPGRRALLLALTLIQLGDRMTSHGDTYFSWYFIGVQAALVVLALREERFQTLAAKVLGPRAAARLAEIAGPAIFAFLVFAAARDHLAMHWPAVRYFPLTGPAIMLVAVPASAALVRTVLRGATSRWMLAPAAALAAAAVFAALQTTDALLNRMMAVRPVGAAACGRSLWVDLPKLGGLRVCENTEREFREVGAILAALPASERPVLIVPEHHYLYAVIDQAPPFPFLWLDPGLTYRAGPETDARIIEAAKAVRTIVLTASDPRAFALEFPGFDAWLKREFEVRARPGGATLLSRRRS